VFDSIPQDAFAISQGQLFESLVNVSIPLDVPDTDDTALLSYAELTYHNEPVDDAYYEDPIWNRLLYDYCQRLNDSAFLFPTAGLVCLGAVRALTGGPVLVLWGDRGYRRDEALLEGGGIPHLALHGSFSLRVDYQPLGEFCRYQGGQALHPAHRHKSLHV